MPNNNKESWLEKPEQAYQLSVSDLGELFEHYKEKKNIEIVLNGSTSYGKELQKKQLTNDTQLTFLNTKFYAKANDDIKYALYMSEYWIGKGMGGDLNLGTNNSAILHSSLKHSMPEVLANYLDREGKIKTPLTHSDLKKMNGLIIRHLPQLKTVIDNLSENVHKKQSKIGLSRKNAILEIREIQKTLKDDQQVGYFYTNGSKDGKTILKELLLQRIALFILFTTVAVKELQILAQRRISKQVLSHAMQG